MFLFAIFRFISSDSYAAVIDAGNTKTALHVFQLNGTNTKEISITNSINTKPLHHALYDKSLITEILKPQLEVLNETIKSDDRKKTKLFLFGTNGIRNLNEDEQEKLMKLSREYLQKNSEFIFKDDYVKTIDIIEESIYYWISVNLILNRFDDNNNETVAVASFGSSALQVTFEPQDDNFNQNRFNVVLDNGRKFNVYTYANDHLKSEEVKLTHLKELAKEQGKSAVESPCFPNGVDQNSTIDYTGKWNGQKCYDSLSNNTLIKGKCKKGYCLFGDIAIPLNSFNEKEIFAISGFAYADEYFKLDKDLSINEHMIKTDEVCSGNIPEINTNPYVVDYCFHMKLTDNFLIRGLGCNNETNSIHRVNKLENEIGDSIKVDWQLGAIMARAVNTKITPDDSKSKKLLTIIIGVVAGIIVILSIVFIIVKCRELKDQEDLSGTEENNKLLENTKNEI